MKHKKRLGHWNHASSTVTSLLIMHALEALCYPAEIPLEALLDSRSKTDRDRLTQNKRCQTS